MGACGRIISPTARLKMFIKIRGFAKGSLERCRFRFLTFLFLFFRFFLVFFPFSSILFVRFIFRKKRGDTVRELSDPRTRNHKPLAIGNHNFEIASFSRRNRNKITMSQSQNSHWAKKIAAIRNHTFVVATISGRFLDLCDASETL